MAKLGGLRGSPDPVTGLTKLEREFVEAWIENGHTNATGAYMRIRPNANEDTAKKEAREMLHRPRVVAYLAKINAESEAKLVERTVATREWIEQKLVEIVEIGMAAVPVRDKKGNETGEYQSTNLPAANQALRMLGMERGMYVEKRETGKPGEFTNLTEDELEKRVRERSAKLGVVVHLPARKKSK